MFAGVALYGGPLREARQRDDLDEELEENYQALTAYAAARHAAAPALDAAALDAALSREIWLPAHYH